MQKKAQFAKRAPLELIVLEGSAPAQVPKSSGSQKWAKGVKQVKKLKMGKAFGVQRHMAVGRHFSVVSKKLTDSRGFHLPKELDNNG